MRLTKYEPQESSMFPYQLQEDELRNRLTAIHKLGLLEDFEEELGIELLTLIKVLKDGAWYIHRTEKRKYYEYEKHPQLKLNYDRWCICFDYEHCYPISLYLDKNDGWALTKEELE